MKKARAKVSYANHGVRGLSPDRTIHGFALNFNCHI